MYQLRKIQNKFNIFKKFKMTTNKRYNGRDQNYNADIIVQISHPITHFQSSKNDNKSKIQTYLCTFVFIYALICIYVRSK